MVTISLCLGNRAETYWTRLYCTVLALQKLLAPKQELVQLKAESLVTKAHPTNATPHTQLYQERAGLRFLESIVRRGLLMG